MPKIQSRSVQSSPPSAMLKVQQQPQGGQYKALQIFVVALCVPTSLGQKSPAASMCHKKHRGTQQHTELRVPVNDPPVA